MPVFEHLLSPGRIGSLELRNRIVMAPMGSNLCEPDGRAGERLQHYYETRARGGAGLVIVEVTAIAWPYATSNPNHLGLSSDAFLPDLERLTRRIHAAGARCAIQLQHAGKVATRDIIAGRPLWVPSKLKPGSGDLYRDLSAEDVAAATADFSKPGAGLHYHEMTPDDVARVCELFAAAAERARRAGFDAVELHAGHGYLLSSFLSPHSNRRTDGYGGPLEHRARFLVEAIEAVRSRVGADFPLWCRMDGREFDVEDGITIEDAGRTAELAEAAGLDAIHVSAYADPMSGIAFTQAPLVHEPGGFVALAEGIKRRVDVPVIAVGRIEPELGNRLIAEGRADFITMGRKLIADPELPNKLAAGRSREVRPCVYAYRCVGNIFVNRRAHCVVNPTSGREFELAPELEPARDPGHVVVVGGGVAGLETARIAACRGHRVTVLERGDRLGGTGRLAGLVESSNAALLRWLEHEVARHGVTVELGVDAGRAELEARGPDAIVLATGARRSPPGWVQQAGLRVLDLAAVEPELEKSAADLGPSVAVVGDDAIALGIAHHLASLGLDVHVVGSGPHLGGTLPPPRLWRLLHALRRANAGLHRNTRVLSADAAGLRVERENEVRALPVQSVIVAEGAEPDDALASELAALGRPLHRVGDCAGLGYFEGAFRDAATVGRAL